MALQSQSIREQRRDQLYPTFDPTEIERVRLEGHGGVLEGVRWRIGATGEEVRRAINHLFLFIGAEPNTNWLNGSGVSLDAKGFVLTGDDAGGGRHTLETTRRGIFAIGDVRAKSVKRRRRGRRGRSVVAALHTYLAGDKPNLEPVLQSGAKGVH
jgi:thioredoxin reductase (NADPH)